VYVLLTYPCVEGLGSSSWSPGDGLQKGVSSRKAKGMKATYSVESGSASWNGICVNTIAGGMPPHCRLVSASPRRTQ
jgi:hypothetical protein